MKWILPLLILPVAMLANAAELSVGFGEVDVSPKIGTKPVYIAGYGHNRKAKKVHDPLMARAVILFDGKTRIAMVSVDVVGLFNEVAESVRKKVSGFDYICISSTHNHEGPDTLGLWGSSPFNSGIDPDYMKELEAGIIKSIKAADANVKPATAKIASIKIPELLHDGREPYVLHDDLFAIRFEGKDGKPVGVLVQWNCHPELMGDKNEEITADHVYYTVEEMKKAQGCPIAYFTGTVGGLMTSLHVPLKNAKGEDLQDGTWEKTELFGRRVGEAGNKALKTAVPVTLTPFEARRLEVHVPVANEVFKLGWRAGILNREFYLWEKTPYPAKPVIAKDLTQAGALKSEVGYMKLGEVEIAVIPGEIYPELVLGKVQDPVDPGADFPDAPIEKSIFGQLKSKYKLLIGLGNDEIGYIIPKRQWDAKAPYCYGRKKDQYGEINSVGPDAAAILCDAFAELVKGKK